MTKTRNQAKGAQSAVAGTCFICNTVPMTDDNICYGCTKRLKAICTNNKDEIDKVIADAIKIGRAQNRRTLVRRAAQRLVPG